MVISMREFMEMIFEDIDNEERIIEVTIEQKVDVMESIKLLLEELRSYTDGNDGEFALGVETGMQKAADMLERVTINMSKENCV